VTEFFRWLIELVRGARFWRIVQPWERAVRTRAGKRAKVLDAGFHLVIPWLDEVRPINTRLRVAAVPLLTVTTKDGRTISVGGSIGFRIVDPLDAMLRLHHPTGLFPVLAQAAIAGYIVSRSLDALVVGEVEAATLDELREAAGAGIAIDFFRIVDFAAVRTYRLLDEQWRPHTNEVEGWTSPGERE
jgi:regulator of protease activity HflC (stomatin/prohibitin superfamily)